MSKTNLNRSPLRDSKKATNANSITQISATSKPTGLKQQLQAFLVNGHSIMTSKAKNTDNWESPSIPPLVSKHLLLTWLKTVMSMLILRKARLIGSTIATWKRQQCRLSGHGNLIKSRIICHGDRRKLWNWATLFICYFRVYLQYMNSISQTKRYHQRLI